MSKRQTSTKIPVLLDTEVYDRLRLNFENPKLRQLVEFVKDGDIELLTTEVINSEVRAHLRKRGDEILARCRTLASDLSCTRDESMITASHALNQMLEQNLQGALSATFEHFLQTAKVREIPIPGGAIKTVLDDYFAIRPPFGTGGKRKEFPDAISICAAQDFGTREKRTVIFVSHDNDIKAACDRFDCLQSAEGIDDVMAGITKRHHPDPRIISNVKKLLSSRPDDKLRRAITRMISAVAFRRPGRRNDEVFIARGVSFERLQNGRVLRFAGDKVFAAVDAIICFRGEIFPDYILPYAERRMMRLPSSDLVLIEHVPVRVDLEILFDSDRNISNWRVIQVNWEDESSLIFEKWSASPPDHIEVESQQNNAINH